MANIRRWKIPKSVQIYGHVIEVVHRKKQMIMEGEASDGLSYYNANRIELYNPGDRDAYVDLVFLHELMHFMLYYTTNEKLSYIEPLVQSMAVLLQQYLNTAKYDKKHGLIPISFECGGQGVFRVKWKKDLKSPAGDAVFATSDFERNAIYVSVPDKEYCESVIESCFFLQLLALFSMMRHDSTFEKHTKTFVILAHILHQVIKDLLAKEWML